MSEEERFIDDLLVLVEEIDGDIDDADEGLRYSVKPVGKRTKQVKVFWTTLLLFGVIVYAGAFYMLANVSSLRFSAVFYVTCMIGASVVVYSAKIAPDVIGRRAGGERSRAERSRGFSRRAASIA